MAVENHPKYPDWSNAVDLLAAARDDLAAALIGGVPAEIDAARRGLSFAMARYGKVSREMGLHHPEI